MLVQLPNTSVCYNDYCRKKKGLSMARTKGWAKGVNNGAMTTTPMALAKVVKPGVLTTAPMAKAKAKAKVLMHVVVTTAPKTIQVITISPMSLL